MEQPTEKNLSQTSQFAFEIKTFSFKQGVGWVTRGFDLFKQNALMWVLGYTAYLGCFLLLNMIPYIGSLIAAILASGIYIAVQQQDQNVRFDITAILNRIQQVFVPLAALSIINALISQTIFYFIMGDSLVPIFAETPPTQAQVDLFTYNAMIALCVYIIPAMAFIFSPIIIVLHPNVSLPQAIIFSFKACILNTMALTAFGLIFAALFLISFIPLGLGLLIVLPISICSLYVAHKDIFCVDSDSSSFNTTSRDDVMSA